MENEKNLFNQIQKGDQQSFELLFKTYYAPLCLFAHKYIYDQDECEEVVQAFFLKLWESRKTINITTSVKSYLYSSVRNRCLNYIKHLKIKQEYQSEMVNSPAKNNFDSNTFLEIDLIEKINQCIDSLPPRRKEIFILSREHGLKYREIAEQLGLSIKTVEAQMGQALKDLREQLKDYKQLLISFLLIAGIKRIGVCSPKIVKVVHIADNRK
ncbi:MAG: RNA polymerase sigma-70 factor [Prolixibacteraceae bacterium]|jgi:RNA polymerase sigma-70 factor (ECF subfamily)|nr:RNA polymerase sigma-70 factor [Prolixibacteraceae bacterium]